ncbi:MAG: hypothetical protein WC897_01905 [Candidatus Gracilibacteria bacterium]
MFFFKGKALSTRQTAVIGFVLAVLSMLVTAVTVFVFPLLGAWLNQNGVLSLDLFYLLFCVVFFCSLQGLILFGFPLYYAQDQKSHMTGFRILVCAVLWMILMMGLLAISMVTLQKQSLSTAEYDMSDFNVSGDYVEVQDDATTLPTE